MRHTEDEIERAAQRFERLAEELDPDTARVDHVDDLREIAAAANEARTAEGRLREAVKAARDRGRSWNQIAVALGVSRQAARQRFGEKAPPGADRVRRR